MKKYCFLLMSLLIMTNAHGKILGTSVSETWGLGSSEPDWNGLGRCYGTGEDSFGAGVINKNTDHTQWRKFLKGHFGETAVYYVAHKIATNGKGGYFCATVVDADRKGCTHKPYTVYYAAATPHCFWACADNYFGEDCKNEPKDRAKNVSDVSATEYDVHGTTAIRVLGTNPTSGGNIRDTIDSIFTTGDDSKQDCSGKNRVDFNSYKNQRVDILLALKYTKAENSEEIVMQAQPMGVRAGAPRGCEDRGDYQAWPLVGFIGTAKYVCPDGFMLNSLKNNESCIRSTEANIVVESMCDGEPKSKYDSSIHKTETKSGSNSSCTVVRCKTGAFKAAGDYSCVDCFAPRQGADSNGVCVTCTTGEIYSSTQKGCVQADQLSKMAMQFGKNNDASTDIDYQCWAKSTPDDYKQCITK